MALTLERTMPMTDDERDLRSLVRGRLALWGDIQRHGPPAPTRGERSGGGFGSRLPVPTWCTDLTIAFAALNPDTAGLAARGDTAWLVHAPFNDLQLAIWGSYVDDDTRLALPPAPARFQFEHERDRALKLARLAHESARDVAIGARLGWAPWRVRRTRDRAIGLIARSVRWDVEDEG